MSDLSLVFLSITEELNFQISIFIADYKELAKPLKKPPHGLEWRRLEDGAWELRSIGKAISRSDQQEQDKKEKEEGDRW